VNRNSTTTVSIIISVFLGVGLCMPARAVAQSAAKPMPRDWQRRVCKEHPRMFFNAQTWPQVKAYALQHEKGWYDHLKRLVARFPAKADRKTFETGANKKYGPYAQMAAFIWRMEGDRSALEKARNYLLEGVRFYNRCSSARKTVNWYSASRVCAMTAYDWIYDQLTPAERKEIGRGFFKHYTDCLSGRSFPGQNRSNQASGYYGPTNMAWYVGLTFYADGIDDRQAERLLKQGYDEHIKLLDYRKQAAGDDGGMASLAVGYAFGMYPWAEYNFMHTYNSATGLAIEKHYDHLSLFANWVLWNRLPGHMRYGLADSSPAGRFGEGFLEMHMLQAAHFYARQHPDRARLAMWVRKEMLTSQKHDNYWWPLAPLLVTRCGELPEPKGPDATWPLARNFERMGIVFMRSGLDESATHAAFIAGGKIKSHRHYDQGHFVIYRKGHLAIDSGDYGPRKRNDHLAEYLYRTVAHNSLLIHAPPEADRPPKVWGGAARTLDGGQWQQVGQQVAFETSAAYSYAATDMTACYAPAKCKQAVRQFVFVHPDTFVIFDRVTAARADYRKVWLLHSVNQPEVDLQAKTFRVEYADSALVGHVLSPSDARIVPVGGPGKEFLSAGKNRLQQGKHKELSGAWRVEVSPGGERKSDLFLHVLRIGEKSLKTDADVKLVNEPDKLGATLKTSAGKAVTVTFNTAPSVGGHIKIGGDVDRPLATTVQPQVGIAAKRNP